MTDHPNMERRQGPQSRRATDLPRKKPDPTHIVSVRMSKSLIAEIEEHKAAGESTSDYIRDAVQKQINRAHGLEARVTTLDDEQAQTAIDRLLRKALQILVEDEDKSGRG